MAQGRTARPGEGQGQVPVHQGEERLQAGGPQGAEGRRSRVQLRGWKREDHHQAASTR